VERDEEVDEGETLVCIVFMLFRLLCATSYMLKVGAKERAREIGVEWYKLLI